MKELKALEGNIVNSFHFVKEDIKELELENKELKKRLRALEENQRRILFILTMQGMDKKVY